MLSDNHVLPTASGLSWLPMEALPFQSWEEVCLILERLISQNYPEARVKFMTWFNPMPFIAVLQSEDNFRVQLRCSNQHRMQEAERIRPVVERMLSTEVFSGHKVELDLQVAPLINDGLETKVSSTRNSPNEEPVERSQKKGISGEDSFIPHAGQDQELASSSEPEESISLLETPTLSDQSQETRLGSLDSLIYYQQKLGIEISARDLDAVLGTLGKTHPDILRSLEEQRLSPGVLEPPKNRKDNISANEDEANQPNSAAPLNEILVDPTYATLYDEIVHSHSSVYLPAYFVRHLRHMGASDGLRFMALRQIAYKLGLKDKGGSQLAPSTVAELARWSTLSERSLPGNLTNQGSYLYLLAGQTPYMNYYESRPANTRWEDAAGYHWKTKEREFIVWKKDNQPSNDCSQLYRDYKTGEVSWRQAPAIYRVQMSMPLAPEDAQSLRHTLSAFGIQTNPLGAIAQCLALSRDEIIPDKPQKIVDLPVKLYTVQELVMEEWGLSDRSIAAQVAVQAKILEDHLIRPTDLLKIPFYLLEKWGKYHSPAQLWTIIILMDHVYADTENKEVRDVTVIKRGIKEMTCWTEEEFTIGVARKISKWLHPFSQASKDDGSAGTFFNPWFSVFANEIRTENGGRAKNPDQSSRMKLRVMPRVPLTPEDTLTFAYRMGLSRLLARDADGALMGIEITPSEFVVYAKGGRTIRYSHGGKLLFGEQEPVVLKATDRDLCGIELISDEQFYDLDAWDSALFCSLEKGPGALFCGLENRPTALSFSLEKEANALFCSLALEPDALFCVLLKLLILNLYEIKNNSLREQPPSTIKLSQNVSSLEQYGSRQGYYMQWTEEVSDSDWDFVRIAKSMGITDIKSLQEAQVAPEMMVACAFELYATPKEKFTSGRIAVLVSKLRKNPAMTPGPYQRLAELGPDRVQAYLRRSIANWPSAVGDPDWDSTLGKAKRDDLIELTERLGLGHVLRVQQPDS